MAKIKVAFFADILIKDFDGASRTMFQILNRIPKSEFDYLFICGVEPKHDVGFEVIKLPTMTIPRNNTYEMAVIAFSKKRVRQKLDEFAPDIIHFASPSQISTFASKYARSKGIPLVTIYHTHFLAYMKYYFNFAPFLVPTMLKIVAKICKRIYDRPNIVYIPTEEIKKQLLEKADFKGHNLRIWGRGLDQKRFDPLKRNTALIQEITKNDKPNVLYASRLVMEKNVDVLSKLYQLIKKDGDQVNLIIVGDGAARKDLEKKMPGAFFLGNKNHQELAIIYASCDVFFFPSTTETFGNVIPEAMASGIPCILSNEGGHVSYVEQGKTALLCSPDDAKCCWEAIQSLIHNSDLKKEIVANALKFTKTLNWENLVDQYFDDLRMLANKKKRLILQPQI